MMSLFADGWQPADGSDPLAGAPFWFMRQAGRYLPEYRALRAEAGSFMTLCLTPELATEITLQPMRRFDPSAAILFSDILIVPHALGRSVRFEEGRGPVLDPLDPQDFGSLDLSAVAERSAPVAETVRRLRAALPADKTLIGFAGSPWTVACYMLTGSGGGEFLPARRLAWEAPHLLAAVLDRIVEATAIYLDAQIAAGADCIMLFDSWSGLVPQPFADLAVLEPTRRLVEAVRASAMRQGRRVPVIGFPKGFADPAGYAAATGVDIVAADSSQVLRGWTGADGRTTGAQGNLDPLALQVAPEDFDAVVARWAAGARAQLAPGTRFVFNLGHGLTPQTPVANVARLAELLHEGLPQ